MTRLRPLIAVALALVPGVAWANGSLKVTSFPTGAEVWVDGTNTGKTTPMSTSLPEGEHIVTVLIPNSGWTPDSRTVTIVTGNNDLSVTLLPVLTSGPPGPPGPKGDKGDTGETGDTGPQGEPGTLALAGVICPAPLFMVGFSLSGQVLCDGPEGTGPVPAPIPLPYGVLLDDYLSGLSGSEANASLPFQFNVQIGTLQGQLNLVGFAFCQPPDLLALPSLTPPAYPCAPAVDVSFVANNPTQATLTIDVGHLFARVTGDWNLSPPLSLSGSISGYALFTGVKFQLGVPIVDAGDGLKRFDPPTSSSVTALANDISLDFGNDTVNALAALLESFAIPNIRSDVAQAVQAAATALLATIPPFVW